MKKNTIKILTATLAIVAVLGVGAAVVMAIPTSRDAVTKLFKPEEKESNTTEVKNLLPEIETCSIEGMITGPHAQFNIETNELVKESTNKPFATIESGKWYVVTFRFEQLPITGAETSYMFEYHLPCFDKTNNKYFSSGFENGLRGKYVKGAKYTKGEAVVVSAFKVYNPGNVKTEVDIGLSFAQYVNMRLELRSLTLFELPSYYFSNGDIDTEFVTLRSGETSANTIKRFPGGEFKDGVLEEIEKLTSYDYFDTIKLKKPANEIEE